MSRPTLAQSLILFSMCICLVNAQKFDCPSSSEIDPCTCQFNSNFPTLSSVECQGAEVTQDRIQNLFDSLRSLNNISSVPGDGEALYIPNFTVSLTQLTSLDLSPFINMEFGLFGAVQNPSLRIILAPTNSTDENVIESFRFSASTLDVTNTQLTDGSVATILKFLNSQQTQILELGHDNIQGSAVEGGQQDEFLPGLSSFTNVYVLSLPANGIYKLGQALFRNLTHLTALDLSDNSIEELGPNSLLIDNSDLSQLQLNLFLRGNDFNDTKIHPECGFHLTGRPTGLFFERNNFQFISQSNFQPFLLANERNSLQFRENHFICDEMMRWLKDQRDQFEHRVDGIFCENDPGQTIFTTDLLP